MNQIIVITGIVIFIVSVIALIDIAYFYLKGLFENNYEIFRHVISGIGAAILAPIIFKSAFPENIEINNNDFFVLTGFCFVAGYFSDRIINTVGIKILNALKNTKSKVDQTINKAEKNHKVTASSTENKNNLGSIVVEKDSVNQNSNMELKIQEEKIINSFSEKNKIRTTREIATELKANSIVVNSILEELHGQGKLKKLTCLNGNEHWSLTQLGTSTIVKEN
ncbi:MAG: hypothetical protein GZ091_02535 [Paludibacter sp.]|nr:hypothetical protein [Paludibacter sp.]